MRKEKREQLLNILDYDKVAKVLDLPLTGRVDKLNLYKEYTPVKKGLPKELHPRYGKKNSNRQKNKMRKIMLTNNPMKLEENKKYGKSNPNYGVPSPHRRPVTYKGIDYPSVKHMALTLNMSRKMCRYYLRKEV